MKEVSIFYNMMSFNNPFLFIGDNKKTYKFCRLLSLFILCNKKNDKNIYCNCNSCSYFLKHVHPDYLEYSDSNLNMDRLRFILEKLKQKSIISKKKVVLINNFDSMNKNVLNSLLKILEELSCRVLFLITSNSLALPNTIIDRCYIYFIKSEKKPVNILILRQIYKFLKNRSYSYDVFLLFKSFNNISVLNFVYYFYVIVIKVLKKIIIKKQYNFFSIVNKKNTLLFVLNHLKILILLLKKKYLLNYINILVLLMNLIIV